MQEQLERSVSFSGAPCCYGGEGETGHGEVKAAVTEQLGVVYSVLI
jgi:hypothetical protein